MTAASNSDARKRNAAQVDPVEVVERAMLRHGANLYGSCPCGSTWSLQHLRDSIVAALRAEGLLS